MAPQPHHDNVTSSPHAPLHPVPQLQGPFEESMMESLNDCIEQDTNTDPTARRNMLLAGKKYERIVAGRWKQKPGEKFHPLWKITAQISFGMHLLARGMAKSDAEVMKILQSHVDDIDGFLERTTEDFDLAQSDVQERLRYLKLPLEHVEVLDRMLEDRAFRASIVDGNEKIEHIVERTSEAMKDALKDVQKGLDSTNALGKYLIELGDTWSRTTPEHDAVYNAMVGNVEGWNRAFVGLHLQGNKLAVSLVQLAGVVAEMQRRAGVASRRLLARSVGDDKAGTSVQNTTGRRHELEYTGRKPPRSFEGQPRVSEKPLPQAPDPLRPAWQTAREKIAYEDMMRRESSPVMKGKSRKEKTKHKSQQARPLLLTDRTRELRQQVSAPDLASGGKFSRRADIPTKRTSPTSHSPNTNQTLPNACLPAEVEFARDGKTAGIPSELIHGTPVELEADVPPKVEKRRKGLRMKKLRLPVNAAWGSRDGDTPPCEPSSPRVISAILSGPLFPRRPAKSRSSSDKGSGAFSAPSPPDTSSAAERAETAAIESISPEALASHSLATECNPFFGTGPPQIHHRSESSAKNGTLDEISPITTPAQQSVSRQQLGVINLAFTSHPPDAITPATVSPAVLNKECDRPSLLSRLSTVPAVQDLESKHTSYHSILGEPGPEIPSNRGVSVLNQPVPIAELESHTTSDPMVPEIRNSVSLVAPEGRGSTLERNSTLGSMRSISDFRKLPVQQRAEHGQRPADSAATPDHAPTATSSNSQDHHPWRSSQGDLKYSSTKPRAHDPSPAPRRRSTRSQFELLESISSTPPQSTIHARSSSGASSRSTTNSAPLSISRNPHSASSILAPPDEAPAPPAPGGRTMVNPDFTSAGAFEGERKPKRSSAASNSGWKKMFAAGYPEGRSSEESAGMMSAGGKDVLWFKGMGPDGVWVAES